MGQTALAHPETAESPSALNTNLGWLLAQASYAVTTEMTAAFADLGVLRGPTACSPRPVG